MREEAESAVSAVEARLAEAEQGYEAAAAAAEEASQAAIARAAEAAAAEAKAVAKEEHAEAMRAARLAYHGVGALANVLNQDMSYKHVSHATHQLAALVQSLQVGLHAKPAVRALQTPPVLAEKLGDDLLKEAFAPLAAKGGAQAFAKTPTRGALHPFRGRRRSWARCRAGSSSSPGLWGHALAAVTSALPLVLPSPATRPHPPP